jgi:hypothetical protein
MFYKSQKKDTEPGKISQALCKKIKQDKHIISQGILIAVGIGKKIYFCLH